MLASGCQELSPAVCRGAPRLCQGDCLPRASIRLAARPELRIHSQEQREEMMLSPRNTPCGVSVTGHQKNAHKQENKYMKVAPHHWSSSHWSVHQSGSIN